MNFSSVTQDQPSVARHVKKALAKPQYLTEIGFPAIGRCLPWFTQEDKP
jgi:hypothetical protein